MRKLKITSRGWPWQTNSGNWAATGKKFGWNPLKVIGLGRFGGGWAFKLGITVSSRCDDICLDLIIGSMRIKLVEREKQKPNNITDGSIT